jgi:hypothetical protein
MLIAIESGLLSIVADSVPATSPGSAKRALANPPAVDGSDSPVEVRVIFAVFLSLGWKDAAVGADRNGLHSVSMK